MRSELVFGMTLWAMFVGGAAAGTAAEKHAMTFEDHAALKALGGLAVSPDNSRLAFVVSGRDLEKNGSWSQVRVMQVKSGKWFQVTAGGAKESSPAWSPDGKSLAFVSDQSGMPQVWVSEAAEGAKPRPVTSLSTGAGGVKWASDGTTLLFVSDVLPDCDDDACNKRRQEEAEANPVRAKVFTRLMYRHWDHWRDGSVTHLFAVPAAGGAPTDLMLHDAWGIFGSWAPARDGTVIYSTKSPENEALSTNVELARVKVVKTQAEVSSPEILTSNPAMDDLPVVSPDGKRVSYLSHQRPGFESDRFRLTTLPLAGKGVAATLAESIDQWVGEHGWFKDSASLWFSVMDQGRISVFTTRADGKKPPKKILGGAYFTGLTLSPDSKSLFAVRQTLTEPPEIWRLGIDGKKVTALTDVNREIVERVEFGKVEDFWWEGAGGRKIHGLLIFPPGTSKETKNPFLLLIHGGPQGMWEDAMHPRWNAQLFAAPGYVTLAANPTGSSGYGQQLVDDVSRDWGGKPYEDLMKGVDALVEKGWVDPDRMCAGGGSYGGYMANWILASTDRFECLISHAGVFDLRSMYGSTEELWFPEWEYGGPYWASGDYEKWSPSARAANFRTPTLVIHGANDFRVPESQAMQLFTALQRLGVPSRFLYYPDETHFVAKPRNSQVWYREVHEWLDRWIGKGSKQQ
jgi:dipeptidyl aminopeptidase/acylaminoacyl peptidase